MMTLEEIKQGFLELKAKGGDFKKAAQQYARKLYKDGILTDKDVVSGDGMYIAYYFLNAEVDEGYAPAVILDTHPHGFEVVIDDGRRNYTIK